MYPYHSDGIGQKVPPDLVWRLSQYDAVRQAHEPVGELWWERYASPGLKPIVRKRPSEAVARDRAGGRQQPSFDR